ncbi:MAG: hypothetical protein KC591_08250 [Gemmatimonadetes bacterium]|nr:hypothetical protein [Gemmatimonadota bacterium]
MDRSAGSSQPGGRAASPARSPLAQQAIRVLRGVLLVLGILAVVAIMAIAWPNRVRAQGLDPPLVLLDGEQVPAAAVPPQLRDGEWFIPASPIARALWATLEFDPVTMTVRVTDPLDGTTLEYVGTTGEGLLDHSFALSLAPGLAVGTTEEDLLLPVRLISVLFDLQAVVSPLGDEISLISRRAGGPIDGLPAVGLRELAWRGSTHRYADRTDGALSMDARGRVGDRGRFDLHGDGQVTPSGDAFLGSATGIWQNGTGDTWALGDVRGSSTLRWLGTYGRGLRVDRERARGEVRWSAGWLRLQSGHESSGGYATSPTHDGQVALLSRSWGARPGASIGTSWGLGAAITGERASEKSGVLLASEYRRYFADLRWETRAGLYGSPGEGLGNRLAWETSADWVAREDLRLHGRAGLYGREFRLPVTYFPEQNTIFLSLGGRWQASRRWVVSASHSTNDRRDAGNVEHWTTETLTWQVPSLRLRTLSATLTQSASSETSFRNEFLFDARGQWRAGDWFSTMRRVSGASGYTGTTGATARFPGVLGQTAASWSERGVSGVSAYLTKTFGRRRPLRVTAGGNWSLSTLPNEDPFLGSVRVSWDFLPGHGMEAAYDEHPASSSSRLQWYGQMRFAEGRSGGRMPGDRSERDVSRIEGRIWLDRNANGEFDRGDRALEDVEVVLDDGLARTRTDADGNYLFARVRAGKHGIRVTPETVRADLSLMDELARPVIVPAYKTARADWRTCTNRKATGVVFRDLDGDGVRDPDEPGIAEAHVMIENRGDTITDRLGRWRVRDLPPGVHLLRVDESSLAADEWAGEAVEIVVLPDADPEAVDVPVRVKLRPVTRKVFEP